MTVKFYAETGFNSVDIPDSPTILETNFTPVKTYADINVIQDLYLAYVIVDDIEMNTARNIDYCIIVDNAGVEGRNKSCYTVEKFEFTSDGICKFYLLLDAYNTMGGFGDKSGNLILGASANRMSVSEADDNTIFFNLDEPFKPAERSTVEFISPFGEVTTKTATFVEVVAMPPLTVEPVIYDGMSTEESAKIRLITKINKTCEGTGVGEYMMETSKGSGDTKVSSIVYGVSTTPKLRKLIPTTIGLYNPFNEDQPIGLDLHVRWFDTSLIDYEITIEHQETQNGDLIQDFREQGMDNNITKCWSVPSTYLGIGFIGNYMPAEPTNYGGVVTVDSTRSKTTLSITPSTCYNNKARYSQSVVLKMFNGASGNSIDKKIIQVINAGSVPSSQTYSVDVVRGADIRPDGYPIGAFKYIDGVSQENVFAEIVNGATWRQIPLLAFGISGEYQQQQQLKRENAEAEGMNTATILLGLAQLGIGVASTVGSAGTSAPATSPLIATGLATLGGGLSGYISNSIKQQDQQELLNEQSVSSATQLTISDSKFAREMGKNNFYILKSEYSANDMANYDQFLTQYGYNVGNRKVTNTDFYTRPAFNYMRLNDITIDSYCVSSAILDLVKQQLKAGVRIWHKKPNYSDMLASGNRTAS